MPNVSIGENGNHYLPYYICIFVVFFILFVFLRTQTLFQRNVLIPFFSDMLRIFCMYIQQNLGIWSDMYNKCIYYASTQEFFTAVHIK